MSRLHRTGGTIANYHNHHRPSAIAGVGWTALRPLLGALLGALTALLLAACGGERGVAVASPAPPGSQLPGLALRADGAPLLSWVETSSAGHRLAYSTLDNGVWSPPRTVAEGADWFVNWADVAAVVPLDETLWAAHWRVQQRGGMYAYDIALSLSRDGGRHWDPPFSPHQDGTATEHGFVSLWPAPLANGAAGLGAAWLDGREMLHDPAAGGPHDPRTTLRYATFDARGRQQATGIIDTRVCDCCPTAIAMASSGPILVYRDRSPGEVRDIRATGFRAGRWEPLGSAADDGWVIDGCPVNGPAASAAGPSLAVAWYTEAGGRRQVRSAWRDAAGAWSSPVTMASANPLGRVAIAWIGDDQAAVSWLDDIGAGRAALRVARVSSAGAGTPITVATTESSRPDMPRLLRHGSGLLLAWSRWRDGTPQVVVATVPLAALPDHTTSNLAADRIAMLAAP